MLLKKEPAIVINWQQFTKHSENGMGLHAENGFLKILPALKEGGNPNQHKAELMLSHPFSVNEFYRDATFDFNNNTLICEALTEDCF